MQDHKDQLTEQLMHIETNCQLLDNRNQMIEQQLKAQAEFGGASLESIDKIVTIPDPISEKIVKIVSKYNALEDCMAVVKKGYEKDAVDIKDFLKTVRELSKKQAKQINKMLIIEGALK